MVGWPPALGKQIGLSFEIELNAKLNVTLQRCKFVYTIGRMIFFIQKQLNKSAILLPDSTKDLLKTIND